MKANRKSAVPAPREIAIVVFGHDTANKPHASTFTTDQTELAEKAAVFMGMRLLRVGTDDQRALATKLPNGKIFASGKALVPEVRPSLFAKLIALVDPENASHATQADDIPSTSIASNDPSDDTLKPGLRNDGATGWPIIALGNIVIARDLETEAWFEARVRAIEGDLLTLRWIEWPDHPEFVRRFWQVAIVHPRMLKP